MSFVKNMPRPARAAWPGGAAAATLLALAATAQAATAPITPASLTNCSGKVAADRTGTAAGEPYRLGYAFSCDGAVSAYSIVVDQLKDPGGTIDDFGASPVVDEPGGTTPAPSEAATCSGTVPGDGINCNFGAGGSLPQGDIVAGTIDPVAPYCAHVTAPVTPRRTKKGHGATAGKAAKTKKVKPVTPVPRAVVQLIVTDATGAQDGPFTLGPAKPCPAKPVVVPAPTTQKAHAIRAHHASASVGSSQPHQRSF